MTRPSSWPLAETLEPGAEPEPDIPVVPGVLADPWQSDEELARAAFQRWEGGRARRPKAPPAAKAAGGAPQVVSGRIRQAAAEWTPEPAALTRAEAAFRAGGPAGRAAAAAGRAPKPPPKAAPRAPRVNVPGPFPPVPSSTGRLYYLFMPSHPVVPAPCVVAGARLAEELLGGSWSRYVPSPEGFIRLEDALNAAITVPGARSPIPIHYPEQ